MLRIYNIVFPNDFFLFILPNSFFSPVTDFPTKIFFYRLGFRIRKNVPYIKTQKSSTVEKSMLDKLEEKKRKLDEQNKKNQKRRKELLEKEKRQRMSKLSDIGKLAFRANIDQLDDRTLFGAFLEIANNTNDDKLKHWNQIAEDFANSQVGSEKLYSISFEDNPSQEMKKIFKEKNLSGIVSEKNIMQKVYDLI